MTTRTNQPAPRTRGVDSSYGTVVAMGMLWAVPVLAMILALVRA
jgi:hypothetical protein